MTAPAPFTPVDCDLRGCRSCRWTSCALLDSDLFALSTGEEFKVALRCGARPGSKCPAASLPDDDRVLAHLSGAGSRWKRLKRDGAARLDQVQRRPLLSPGRRRESSRSMEASAGPARARKQALGQCGRRIIRQCHGNATDMPRHASARGNASQASKAKPSQEESQSLALRTSREKPPPGITDLGPTRSGRMQFRSSMAGWLWAARSS
jgi:hypothetical protein